MTVVGVWNWDSEFFYLRKYILSSIYFLNFSIYFMISSIHFFVLSIDFLISCINIFVFYSNIKRNSNSNQHYLVIEIGERTRLNVWINNVWLICLKCNTRNAAYYIVEMCNTRFSSFRILVNQSIKTHFS